VQETKALKKKNDRTLKECRRTLFAEESVVEASLSYIFNPEVDTHNDSTECVSQEIEYVCDILPLDVQCAEEVVECPVKETLPQEEERSEQPCENNEQASSCSQPLFNVHASSFADDDKGLHFYTGLENYSKFMLVFNTLWPEAQQIKYIHDVKIAPEDAHFFDINEAQAQQSQL
jgi:hypothetical protein